MYKDKVGRERDRVGSSSRTSSRIRIRISKSKGIGSIKDIIGSESSSPALSVAS